MGIHYYHLAREESYGVVPAPPGLTPNFTSPPSIAYRVVEANIALMLLSTAFLVTRWYTSQFILRRAAREDYSITIAWVLALVHGIASCILTRYGLGRHLWDVPFTLFNNNFGKISLIAGLGYTLSIMFVKISILTFYLRFSSGKALNIVIYTAMAVVTAYSIATGLGLFLACSPTEKYWDITITTGSCSNLYAIFLFSATMNIATDVIILVLPIAMLWGVHLPRRQKFGVVFILMTGGIVLIAAIIRLVRVVLSYHILDTTWDYAKQDVWWALELHLAIVCGCLPLGKAFLRRHFPKVIGRSSQNSYPKTRPSFRSSQRVTLPSREGDELELCVGQGMTAKADFPLRTYPSQLNDGEDTSQKTSFCDAALDPEHVEHTV